MPLHAVPRPQACHSLSLMEKNRLVQCAVDGAVPLAVAEPLPQACRPVSSVWSSVVDGAVPLAVLYPYPQAARPVSSVWSGVVAGAVLTCEYT